jgi:hypothetical protein
MINRMDQKRISAVLAGAILTLTFSAARAQTYTWADNALGQPYEVCPTGQGPETNYYPSNNIWTQSVQTNGNCNNTGTVVSAPSNWDPAPPVEVYPGGPGALGVDVILGPPANTFLNAGTHLNLNSMTIQSNGSLSIGGNWSIVLNSLEFQGDGEITSGSGGFLLQPGGTIIKSGGAGSFSILNPTFDGTNNTIEVDSGTLIFPTGFGAAQVNGGTFVVSNNATLLLTADSGGDPFLNGNITGVGGGTVLINNGAPSSSGCDLYFPGGMLQWTGGTLKSGPWTNSGIVNISGDGPQFYGGSIFYNNNLVNLSNDSSLSFYSTGGAAPGFFNEVDATFNIQGDSSLTSGSGTFYNYGLLIKSAGPGLSQISPIFNNDGGTVEADTGTLELNLTGGGYISNATFIVGSGATIDLITNNYNMEIEGALTGTGGGTVLMSAGTLSSSYTTTFNFPGAMFQWAGGKLGDSYANNVSNINTMTVSGPVGIVGSFGNDGTMIQSGNGGINSGNIFYNYTNAVYDMQNDGGLSIGNIYNYGLLEKTGGTNTSVIYDNFFNYGPAGAVSVSAATMAFTGVNNFFTNTWFAISSNATLVFAPGNANYPVEMEGAASASGGGTMVLSNGILTSDYPATLNFPGSMFQWLGGKIGSGSNPSTLTNIGVINVAAPVAISGALANSGAMIQSGAGSIGAGSDFYNGSGGVYNIQNDSGLSIGNIYNHGLFEKTSGTNTSTILGNFNDWGSIQAPSGTLLFSNGTFTLNAGTFNLSSSLLCQSSIQENGGTITGVGAMGNPGDVSMTVSGGVLAPGNPFGTLSFLGHYGFSMSSPASFSVVLGGSNQFGQLQVPNASATVAGTLNVTLANGYAPAIGTQFQIVSTGSRGGTFSTLNVPQGISVTYSNIGVFLTVTGTVPVDIGNPQIVNTNITFGFGTLSNQDYTIQQNTDLSTTNWTFVTNFTGTGSFFQFAAPVTNIPALFYRVLEQ